MDTQQYVIETDGLGKSYKIGFWGRLHVALNNLDLKVPKGSIYGFLGANGAGKTTTIKLLLGLQSPSRGSLKIFGESIDSNRVKARIGYLPERPILHADLTGNEFLNFHRNLYGRYRNQKKVKSNKELLELVGVPEVGDRLLREFSKGMLQRVGIAQALVNNPDLIILDEPMSGLDPVGRRDVRNLINALSEEGKTIFFSSHILSDVESICDEIAFLEKGVLKAQGSLQAIVSNKDARGTEILFYGVDESKITANQLLTTARKLGQKWKVEVRSTDEIQKTIESIWKSGGTVETVTKVHINLEKALFNTD